MQILQRKYPTRPARPGRIENREFEYIRHGTRALLATFCVPRFLKRGDFANAAAFEERIETWLTTYNRDHAHPYQWTYTGEPLVVEPGLAHVRPSGNGGSTRHDPIVAKSRYWRRTYETVI